MKETKNLKLKMPEKNEYINIDDINDNAEKIDEELSKKADASGGDISETVIAAAEESQAEYPVPAAGDSAKTVLGKVHKFFTDIRNWMTGVCLLGQIVNNCVTDNAQLPLSAAQGKVLMDLYNVLNTNWQNASKETLVKRIYNGKSITVIGIVNGAGNDISFPYPCGVVPTRIDFPSNEVNILNQEIVGVIKSTINGDCLSVTTERKYSIGSAVAAYITWHYD